jgi:hypothetical protein
VIVRTKSVLFSPSRGPEKEKLHLLSEEIREKKRIMKTMRSSTTERERERENRGRDRDREIWSEEDEEETESLLLPRDLLWAIHIRCASHHLKEFQIQISPDATLKQLTEHVAKKLQINEQQQSLRLIYEGKLLPEGCGNVVSSELKNGCFLHVAISPRRNPSSQSLQQHSSNEALPSARALPQTNNHNNPSGPLRGLDILRGQNSLTTNLFTVEDVAVLRSYFTESIQQYAVAHSISRQIDEEESLEEYRFRCETEWMAAQSPSSEFRLNITAINNSHNSLLFPGGEQDRVNAIQRMTVFAADTSSAEIGGISDFIYGLSLGYLIGFLLVFCLFDRNISYRQKLGLICGIILQFATNALWSSYYHHEQSNSSSSSTHKANVGTAEQHQQQLHGNLRGGEGGESSAENNRLKNDFYQNNPLFVSFPFPFTGSMI